MHDSTLVAITRGTLGEPDCKSCSIHWLQLQSSWHICMYAHLPPRVCSRSFRTKNVDGINDAALKKPSVFFGCRDPSLLRRSAWTAPYTSPRYSRGCPSSSWIMPCRASAFSLFLPKKISPHSTCILKGGAREEGGWGRVQVLY
jgi:hypothetical protein